VTTPTSLYLLRQGRREAVLYMYTYICECPHFMLSSLSSKFMRKVLSLTVLCLQLFLVSNNPTQPASHPDMFSLHRFVMLDVSRSVESGLSDLPEDYPTDFNSKSVPGLQKIAFCILLVLYYNYSGVVKLSIQIVYFSPVANQ